MQVHETQPLKGQGKVAEPGRTGGWRLLACSGKCQSLNPKYSMWISITMMMQAEDTYRCICERRRGLRNTCYRPDLGLRNADLNLFGLGSPHLSHSAFHCSLLWNMLSANPVSEVWPPGQRRACLLAMQTIPRLGEQTVVAARLALWGSCGAMGSSQAHPPYKLLSLVTHSQDEADW